MYDIVIISEDATSCAVHQDILADLWRGHGLSGNYLVTCDERDFVEIASEGALLIICDADKLQRMNNAARENPSRFGNTPVVVMMEGVSLSSLYVHDYSGLNIMGRIGVPYKTHHRGLGSLVDALSHSKKMGFGSLGKNDIYIAIERSNGECSRTRENAFTTGWKNSNIATLITGS